MENSELHELWGHVEALLTFVLDSHRQDIPAKDAEEVRAWLDHNELGLAHEALIDTVEQVGLELTEKETAALTATAELMSR